MTTTSTGQTIILGGAPEGFDAVLLARELERGAPVLHIARDDKRMEAMRIALSVVAPQIAVLDLPAWDCLPYDRSSPNPDIAARRMATLAALAQGIGGPFVLLTTLNAAPSVCRRATCCGRHPFAQPWANGLTRRR